MKNKNKELAQLVYDNKLSRRDILKIMSAQGLTYSSLGALLSHSPILEASEPFNWRKFEGSWVKLLLVEHQYTIALIDNIAAFKSLTGINISYEILPEQVYFAKLSEALDNKSTEFDIAMSGAYMSWLYGPQGKFVDLNAWIHDPEKTNPEFDWQDFIPSIRRSCAWNGIPGSELGTDDAKQWCIPWGYEQSSLSYNKDILKSMQIAVPQNLDELIESAAKVRRDQPDLTGIGLRGANHWATIHAGFLSAYANYGERDFQVVDQGKIIAAMNTKGSVEFHKKWVDLVRLGGSKNWSKHTWCDMLDDFQNKRSAMIYDADLLGYAANSSHQQTAGQVSYAPFTANEDADSPTPNICIWALAMSQYSMNKDSAWYFLQWATGKSHGLFGAISRDFVNPVRTSVWQNSRFKSRLDSRYPGYLECHEACAKGSSIKFTAQPQFFEVTTEWSASLQNMILQEEPVDESLDKLADTINQKLQQSGLS